MSEKKLEPEQKAYVALRTAYLEYTRWQPDGDWDTFLSYASDERGPIRSDLIEELRLNEQKVREVLDRRVFGLKMALVQITMMGDGEGLEAAYEGREKMRREAVRAVIADQAVVDAAAEGCRPTGCGTHKSPHECAVAKAVRRG